MEKFSIVNLNEFSWPLNVALLGSAFAVFSLIYNDYYIYYGLVTFAFGVLGHICLKFFDAVGSQNSKYQWLYHSVNVILAFAWIGTILFIY